MIEHLNGIRELQGPLFSLKGVGPKRFKVLCDHGVSTVMDLLLHLPVRYQDRRCFAQLGRLKEGEEAFVRGRVCGFVEERRAAGRALFRVTMEDETGRLNLVWFNYNRAYMARVGKKGLYLSAYGRVHGSRHGLEMVHPEISLAGRRPPEDAEGIVPIYRPISGMGSRMIRGWILSLLERSCRLISDPIPPEILSSVRLATLSESIFFLHRPDVEKHPLEEYRQGITPYHRRLQFDRFFSLTLSLALGKRNAEESSSPAMETPAGMQGVIESALGLRFTGEQISAVEDIAADMRRGVAMNRLLQGEVGCGKTVVALAAAYIAAVNGWQTALVAPTRILAMQHYEYFSAAAGPLGFRVCLAAGGMSAKERSAVERKIGTGESNVIIGTHALLSESIQLSRLGLVIFDEQHRFGVMQRRALSSRALNPHVLTMTATPIPRSLALVLYADRQISVIREMPASRAKVKTVCAGQDMKMEVFLALKDAVSKGERALIICPLIEETEEADLKGAVEMAEGLRRFFPAWVGLLHGRLGPREKDSVMERFRSGALRILVATTVVEVGVHVPKASLMIIEHPERFGLAQLHQLRGRIGRDGSGGACFLMLRDSLPRAAVERIRAFADCSDGFEIASMDLRMRRQGDLSGIRQSGRGELDLEEMLNHPDLFKAAKDWAETIVSKDPFLELPENRFLRKMIPAAGK